MALRSMGFACPSFGSVFRSQATNNPNEEETPGTPGTPGSQRTPSRSRRSLAFFRDRGAASLGALRGWKTSGVGGAEAPIPTGRTNVHGGRRDEAVAVASAPVPRGGAGYNNTAATPPSASASSAHTAAPAMGSSQWSSDGSSPPPTPPPTTPPHPISIPPTSPGTPQGVASRPIPSPRLPMRGNQGLLAASRRQPVNVEVGPRDEDGYRDMVLPCGLMQDEVIDIMYRDLNPEDFEALCKLDERVPKRNTAHWNIMDRLPRVPACECGVTECGICLAELDANVPLVKLPCRHAFHSGCISRWLTQCKNTCPLCQAPIRLSV